MSQPVVPIRPVASFTVNCGGLSCTFDGSSSQGTITAYQWIFGDGTGASGKVAAHTYVAGATYQATLTVITAGGVKASMSQSVTPNSPPSASFTVGCVSLTCTFNAAGSRDADGTIATYAWVFGDGGSAPVISPTHTYRAPGTYTITLVVTDNRGETGEQRQSAAVKHARR